MTNRGTVFVSIKARYICLMDYLCTTTTYVSSWASSCMTERATKNLPGGGRIAENVVQALSRLVVTDAILRIEADTTLDANVVLTVHDEIVLISQANNPDVTMDKLIAHMCTQPSWAKDIPLDAEGGYDINYSK